MQTVLDGRNLGKPPLIVRFRHGSSKKGGTATAATRGFPENAWTKKKNCSKKVQ